MRMTRFLVGTLCVGALCFSCTSGSGTGGSGLRVIEFLESGQDNIPRNRILTFRFSEPVAPTQDFFERLKIRNVDRTPGSSNFTRATGAYTCAGDKVVFTPTLPNRTDRGDAGFKSEAFYTVFLKAGPDALRAESGGTILAQQEFIFDTNTYFEDPLPADPPRAWSLAAVDSGSGQATDISRLDPRPSELAMLDSNALLQAGKVIDPGGGGPPDFQVPWHIELLVSEPLDPATVTTDKIEMFEIFSDATTSADTDANVDATVGHFGDAVNYKVPIKVEVDQGLNAAGQVEVRIRVIPQIVLVDDTRYRLSFGGNILGLDFRQSFIGENGVTGDGQTPVDGGTQPFPEPGGLGYTTEFIVRDRPAISAVRTLAYDPLVDGVEPETGQSALTEDRHNSALYNPPIFPGTAVGFLSGFGDGEDGDYAVSGGMSETIDTGDTPNDLIGNPFTVPDLNATREHNPTVIAPTMVTYDSPEYFEMDLESLTISAGGTLQVIGVNPMLFRVRGIVQIGGTLDVSGQKGEDGGQGMPATGGAPGPAGAQGGDARSGLGSTRSNSTCATFATFLSADGNVKANGPFSDGGEGPGRGMPGGDSFSYAGPQLTTTGGIPATGGGGGSHAGLGTPGADIKNAAGVVGTPGPACGLYGVNGSWGYKNSSIIGIRGQPGPTYGDRIVEMVLLGGSGGGAGGTQHGYTSWVGSAGSGGAGGGGGGSVAIFAAGAIQVPGGTIDASGGIGGKGVLTTGYTYYSPKFDSSTGSGGGGSGGTVLLISGNDINVTAGILDARGGAGGEPSNTGTGFDCHGCNTGGDGGKGFIFLMDADGLISGLIPGTPGEYDTYALGVLTISGFNADRFSSIQAITELFGVGASDPAYIVMSPGDVLANVNKTQAIRIFASSSKGDLDEPLLPNPTSEMGAIEIALVTHVAGSTNVAITGDMRGLNPTGAPNRDAFTRIDARFEYGDPVAAALGPFATIDQVAISFTFNG